MTADATTSNAASVPNAAPPHSGWVTPAWGLAAFISAVVLFWWSVGPLAPAVVGAAAQVYYPPQEPVAARQLAYNLMPEVLKTTDRYRAYTAAVEPSVASLYLMGSSELASAAPENPYGYLREHVSDRDLFLSGRGYFQSLPHAVELAAVAQHLQKKQVALIISPQWFTSEGISPEAFGVSFSASYFEAAMANPALSAATKKRMSERVNGLLGTTWTRPATARLNEYVTATIQAVDARGAYAIDALAEKQQALSQIPPTVPDVPIKGAVPYADVNWAGAYERAEERGRAAVTNNDFGIADDYVNTYIGADPRPYQGSLADLDLAGPSPEYGDLDLFLTVAHELGIEVLLVSVPMNGAWYDYTGYPASRRAVYYEKIRGIASAAGVSLADFSAQEYTPYFLYDIMHLGWKGWLDVTKACLEFERTS